MVRKVDGIVHGNGDNTSKITLDSEKASLIEMFNNLGNNSPEFGLDHKIEEVGKATGLLYHWDHTGDPNRRITGNIEQAIGLINETIQFLERVAENGKNKKGNNIEGKSRKLVEYFKNSLNGFEYRRINQLHSVRGQVFDLRKAMAESISSNDKRKAEMNVIAIMSHLQRQPDAVDIIAQLQSEYHEIQQLAEEFNEGGNDFTIDINELIKKIIESNKDVDQFYPTFEQIEVAFEKLAIFSHNLDLLKNLAEIRDESPKIYDTSELLQEKKEQLARSIIIVLNEVLSKVRKKPGENSLEFSEYFDDITDPKERVESLISLVEEEFSNLKKMANLKKEAGESDSLQAKQESKRSNLFSTAKRLLLQKSRNSFGGRHNGQAHQNVQSQQVSKEIDRLEEQVTKALSKAKSLLKQNF